MALTVLQLADFTRLTLGGPADASLSSVALANMAGMYLVGMSRWKWLDRSPVALATVAAQTYITPPSDFDEPLALESTSTGNYYRWGTLEEVFTLRYGTNQSQSGGEYVGAVVRAAASGSTPPEVRIELFPTPSASTSDVFRLAYRGKWPTLTSDSDYMPFPDEIELLYVRTFQTLARGFMEEDKGTASQRLAEFRMWPEFIAAVRSDRKKQVDHGVMQGSLDEWSPYSNPAHTFSTITGPW
jgi:hypothetical protein